MSQEVPATLITFFGQTISGVASNIIGLNSDILYQGVSTITIPKGLGMKIWGVRVSGSQAVVAINFSKTQSGIFVSSVPHDAFAFNPTLGSPVYLEKNKPILIPGLAGGETISVSYTQPAASTAPSFVEIDAEFVDLSMQ
jgi:hypothetical protein